ncbi:DUF5687 family protein [Flavobacterium agrisoli]|uniref:Uncharacterized protein n=1 Tax=Flavobacterium agrisoli TaxID=2793066 RepID=A0A934UJ71_9FLAO|nr:DUF5687 family protein [Flavobacterium agrisoli]MBK0369602.1 hypothetical protein [Flavobacterium agrisoli]
MFFKFIYLEWKSFLRSASFGTNLALKILMAFLVIYFTLIFLAMGVGAFYVLKKMNLEPLVTVNKFLFYYLFADLVFRLIFQAIPVVNIKPLLVMNIQKNTIVHFSLWKTFLSFFNWIHAFFFLPFSVVLLLEGYDVIGVLAWTLAMFCFIYANNFLNLILNNIDKLFAVFFVIVTVFAGLQYYDIFDITDYTGTFFQQFYENPIWICIPLVIVSVLYVFTFRFFKQNLYLDAGLALKQEQAKTQDLSWLNQFGTIGTFLKNDIKLIMRNKRSKTTVFMSVLFLFYGLIFFSPGMHQPKVMHVFAGIFVSGGFLFVFGQFVPSWDSSYYQLMMTQNIPYRGYLNAKWWLIVIVTAISTVLASFYIFFGWEYYLMIVVGAIYNIGINSQLVLLGGAYTKTPIDLTSSNGAFGDKKAFNMSAMLLTIPKLLVPVLLYGVGLHFNNENLGLLLVALTGILGFVFRNKVFSFIESKYKTEKYSTIAAYKQKK